MPLPKVKVPIHSLTLPSTKQKVDYRGFTVKEEKLLLMAKEDQSSDGFINTITQVIRNCILTPTAKVDNFAIFDIEYFFLKLRSKSVGNIIDILVTDKDDQKQYKVQVDLDDINVVYNDGHTNKIVLDEPTGIGVVMKYPTIRAAISLGSGEDIKPEAIFGLVKQCLDAIFDKEKVYKAIDQSDEELNEWFNDLSADHLAKIQQFFDTFPSIKHTVTYKKSDGSMGSVTLEGIRDFFQ